VSDDGSRVFFSSPDPLVPGLSGGSVKVFEYENGAPQLLSGSESGGEAVFLDASASGDDVFLATRERLAPTDTDELVDVYDARVDGGVAEPPAPVPCPGGACQETAGSAPSLATPISALFSGPGNLLPPPVVKLTRKQLLSRALAKCDKLKTKARRVSCREAAKRRYAPRVTGSRRSASTRRPRSRR
jgi:hypothetical protein